jgi:hypothetical protein
MDMYSTVDRVLWLTLHRTPSREWEKLKLTEANKCPKTTVQLNLEEIILVILLITILLQLDLQHLMLHQVRLLAAPLMGTGIISGEGIGAEEIFREWGIGAHLVR